MYQVELGSTFGLRFQTQAYDEAAKSYVNVSPDIVYAQLEDISLQKIADLIVTEHPSEIGTYDVYFNTSQVDVDIGSIYYIAFYWQYGGKDMCERVKIKVLYDVQ